MGRFFIINNKEIMIKNKDIFDIKKTHIPFTKDEFMNSIDKDVVTGYIPVNYDVLIETIKQISMATEYSIVLNPNEIYNGTNSPIIQNNVLIEVEGIHTFNEFVDNMVNGEDDETWTSFISYSETFKDKIKAIKLNAYKKYLWNYHNIDNWFETSNIAVLKDDKNSIVTDFDTFKERVLLTDDFITFIDNCLDEDIKKALNFIVKQGLEVMKLHRTELNDHIKTANMRSTQITITNPIITKIYALSSIASRCKKDWPKLKVTPLDKKSFETIGLWS